MVNISNKQVVFLSRPTGFPVAGEHLGVQTTQVDAVLEENDILLRNLYVSADPCKFFISCDLCAPAPSTFRTDKLM